MSSSLLLPNPCLLGIVFTIATHDGNQLVFHYPPKPNEYGFQATPLDINELSNEVEGLNDSSEDELYEDEDEDEDEYEDDIRYNDENDDYGVEDEEEDDTQDESEFNDSDLDSVGTKSNRTLSTDSLASDQNRHQRTSSSSNNRYQSGRDLLELMYEREQKKKKKKILKRKQRMRKRKREKKKAFLDSQSAISSLKTSISDSTHNSQKKNQNKEYKVEKLFSFDTDFISDLATPPKSLCNTRFELTVEDMVFLGLPIHIQDDGSWRVSKKSKFIRSKSMSTSQRSRKQSCSDSNQNEDKRSGSNRASFNNSINLDDHKVNDTETKNDDELHDDHIDHHNDMEVLEYTGENSRVIEKDCGMYQFHMLFVMNPPVVEYNHRIDEMFHYIISRISLLLRYEQQKTNYVWEESKKILELKEDLAHLPINQQWKTIIEKSSLAKLICETYKAVSRSQIVNIEINGKLNSFQIPIRREFVVLPPNYVELPEYSTLSSISPFNQLNSYESPTSLSQANDVMAFFGLILLDDTERIIRDIKAEKDSVIASFIRLIKPSESLQRLSVLSGLDIQEVKMFANHLVYWRRAMAILPLTSRSIYVVSPIAPIKNIYKDSPDFNRTFPNLPPLPTFLSMISDISTNKPKSISNIIPSRDHRDLYMDAIAWLFKHGYIIQLYTFLYLKITKEIKIKVAEEVEIEIKRKQELKKKSALIDKDLTGANENNSDSDNMGTDNKAKTDVSDIEDLELTDGEDQSDGRVSSNGNSLIDLKDGEPSDNETIEVDNNGNNKLGARMTDNSAETNLVQEPSDSVTSQNAVAASSTEKRLPNGVRAGKNNPTDNLRDYGSEIQENNTTLPNQYIRKDLNKNNGETGNAHYPSPSGTESYYNNSGSYDQIQFEEEEEEDTILLEPEYSTSLERRWIAKVVEGQPSEISNLFYKVLKYMNGRNAQEVFMTQENISRHDMKKLCDAVAENFVVMRHW
ncbi:hypothetical protein PMKS-003116 [Pichia membranifaciens]|uniref:Nitrogen permease regulator 3 n=1 Tax=Pichia membranifaciens TaxID=4926 RepID=A0A1Q2YJB6_9ASCO|nr:hypothetical protein PMKS-003116 [Pichia membranifaciens]